MVVLIFIFIFISLALLAYLLYPSAEERFRIWHKGRTEKITPKLDQIFIAIPYKKVLLIDILIPLCAGFLAFYFSRVFWVGLLAAFSGLVIPNIIIRQLEKLRRAKFAAQLVDGLMLLSGSLKAGLSLIQAFEALIEEMPAPISQEFSLVLRQNRMGIPLEDCLTKLKQRMQCEELDMIVTVILVARETGGDMTAIFSNLVLTIRERIRLFGKVRALCTQGKLQGKIMMFLPIVFGYSVYKLDPGFVNILINDPQGRGLLIYAVISEILGIIFISRLSKIEI